MSDWVDNIPGDGRENPEPRRRINPGGEYISELNFAKGSRIRVLQDNGTRGLLGLEGVVVQSFAGSVVVELDDDPALRHRVLQARGFDRSKKPRRHFRVTEVERA